MEPKSLKIKLHMGASDHSITVFEKTSTTHMSLPGAGEEPGCRSRWVKSGAARMIPSPRVRRLLLDGWSIARGFQSMSTSKRGDAYEN